MDVALVPATENLCVIDRRSSGSLRRTAAGGPLVSKAGKGVTPAMTVFAIPGSLLLVDSGCVRLQPSR